MVGAEVIDKIIFYKWQMENVSRNAFFLKVALSVRLRLLLENFRVRNLEFKMMIIGSQ